MQVYSDSIIVSILRVISVSLSAQWTKPKLGLGFVSPRLQEAEFMSPVPQFALVLCMYNNSFSYPPRFHEPISPSENLALNVLHLFLSYLPPFWVGFSFPFPFSFSLT